MSHFRSSDATKCLECEEQDRRRTGTGPNVSKGYKTCISCGKRKPARLFNQQGTDICDDCAKTQKAEPVPVQEGFLNKLVKIVISKGFLGAFASMAVVVGVAFAVINLPNGCSDNNIQSGGGERPDTTRTVKVTEKTVDRQELEKLIESGNFKAVYEYVKDKEDAADYKQSLKDVINRHLWSIVDSSNTAQEDLTNFYIQNNEFLDFIGFTENDKLAWKDIVNDYKKIGDILNKPKITDADLKSGHELLAKHSDLFPTDWSQTLSGKPKEDVPQKKEEQKKEDALKPNTGKATFTLTYTQASNSKQVNVEINGSKIGFDGLVGTYAMVTCKNGTIKENNKATYTVQLKEEKSYTIKLDDSITLTITAKTKKKFHKQDSQ